MMERIADGRTDLVFEYIAQGHPVNATASNGVSLIKWCAYYGDVSAIRFLLANGESLASLGKDLGLNAAAFHGHWRLCQFLLGKLAPAARWHSLEALLRRFPRQPGAAVDGMLSAGPASRLAVVEIDTRLCLRQQLASGCPML